MSIMPRLISSGFKTTRHIPLISFPSWNWEYQYLQMAATKWPGNEEALSPLNLFPVNQGGTNLLRKLDLQAEDSGTNKFKSFIMLGN